MYHDKVKLKTGHVSYDPRCVFLVSVLLCVLCVCVCIYVIPTNLTFKKMIIRIQVAINIYRVVCKVNTYTEHMLYICLCTYICHIYIYIVCISYLYRMCYQQLQLAARKKNYIFRLRFYTCASV